jgi:hypothetical protein
MSAGNKILLPVALKIQKTGQIGVVQLHADCLAQRRLAMKGDPEAGM